MKAERPISKAEWPKVRLDECAEIIAGATPSTSVESYWGGDICWATPKDMSELEGAYISDTPRKLTRAGLEKCAAAVLPAGSVLFSSRAPIGHVAVNTVPMATNQGFKSFIPRPERVVAKFLYWWLRTNRAYLESLGNGATFKEVSKAIVSRIEIPLPPLADQLRIADLLDRAEALRAMRRAALAQLDSLTQSLFLDLFGDPATNPKGWPRRELKDVCEAINDCPHTTPTWTSEGVICLRTSNLSKGGWNWDDTRFVSEAAYHERSKRGYVEEGDIVLSREGTVGIAAIVQSGMKICMGQRLVQVRADATILNSEYLLRHLLCVLDPVRIGQFMVGSTSQHLNVKELRALSIPLPPLPLQREFARRVAAVEALKASHRASLAELDALFASLQHRAFRGEL